MNERCGHRPERVTYSVLGSERFYTRSPRPESEFSKINAAVVCIRAAAALAVEKMAIQGHETSLLPWVSTDKTKIWLVQLSFAL